MSKFNFKLKSHADQFIVAVLAGRIFRLVRSTDGGVIFIDSIDGTELLRTTRLQGVYNGRNEASIITSSGSIYTLTPVEAA